MLATGIKSPIGVKVTGTDLAAIDRVAVRIEQLAKGVPGVSSALAERLTGGRYLDVNIDRVAAAFDSAVGIGAQNADRPRHGRHGGRAAAAQAAQGR